mmetsp:Transcript_20952/g.34144  ORF Transcript_20952/g.34144 Transcript_20952/m.34144 type:complete len:301 (-) Transcript_20952:99-1001(-)
MELSTNTTSFRSSHLDQTSDMDFIRSKLKDEIQVLGIYRAGKKVVQSNSRSCLWKAIRCCVPCLWCSRSAPSKNLDNIYYVISNEGLHILVKDYEPETCGSSVLLGMSGEYSFMPWGRVLGVNIITKKRLLGQNSTYLFIQEIGLNSISTGKSHQGGQYWLVDNCDDVARLLENTFIESKILHTVEPYGGFVSGPPQSTTANIPTNQYSTNIPTDQHSKQEYQVWVALADSPKKRKAITIDPSMPWQLFTEKACALVELTTPDDQEEAIFELGNGCSRTLLQDFTLLEEGDTVLVSLLSV